MYRTFVGSVMSLLTTIIISMFTGYKLLGMADNAEYQVLTSRKDYFYELRQEVNWMEGDFAVAAAVTKYDGDQNDITDPSMGEIKFYMKSWGSAVRGGFRPVPQQTCPLDLFDHDAIAPDPIFFHTDEPY